MLSSFTFSENTIGFLIDGKFTTKTSDALKQQILEKLKHFDKINLYLEDTGIEQFSLLAVIKEILFKINNGSRFNKIALVSNRKWIHLCGGIENLFLEAKIKNFESKDRLKAISWIAD